MIVLGTGLSVITLLGFLSSNSNFMTSAGKYLEIIFLMVIIFAFFAYVKLSPSKGQKIEYAKHISSQEFERQRTLYTELKAKELIESPQYKAFTRKRGNL
ncbi:hypothetical protein SteCoe_26931 [Stentor coeruleus]|uniref:Uncharacterized protein n=1 Tax=Stentor coeruleus TaxID=5963 RepID=A0A1R2BBS3_9CILI|nr:hypothetical protein SteCoe_26931 [Stentor coeruleus]